LSVANVDLDQVKQQNREAIKSKKRMSTVASSPASSDAKRARVLASSPASSDATRARVLDASLLVEAGYLASKLRNLAERPEMSGKTGEQLLKALRDNDGLVNKAKNALVHATV